jgi:hypothetical protein
MMATLRPFDWRDLPVLHRYRSRALCLDSALGATRGVNLAPGVLLSFLTPATGIFTWICSDECDEQPLMGQIAHSPEEAFARLTFLAPEEALESPSITDLLEQLAQHSGERGAFNLLAETEENSAAFEPLRHAGFAIYARQRIWQKIENGSNLKPKIPWEAVNKPDAFNVQALYHNVVPGLVQQVEPLPDKQINGLVCYIDGELIGYVDLKYGPRGIWAHPFIHPDATDLDARLGDMLFSIADRRARPIYICVRTYQSWLESALEANLVQAGPSQAIMVKRLAAQQRATRPFAIPQIEGQREITTPVSQSKQNDATIPNVPNRLNHENL